MFADRLELVCISLGCPLDLSGRGTGRYPAPRARLKQSRRLQRPKPFSRLATQLQSATAGETPGYVISPLASDPQAESCGSPIRCLANKSLHLQPVLGLDSRRRTSGLPDGWTAVWTIWKLFSTRSDHRCSFQLILAVATDQLCIREVVQGLTRGVVRGLPGLCIELFGPLLLLLRCSVVRHSGPSLSGRGFPLNMQVYSVRPLAYILL